MNYYDGSLRPTALAGQFANGDQPPSSYAITGWVQGEKGSFTKVVGLTAIRTVFIAPGLYLGGVRDNVWAGAAGASVTITLGIALMKLISLAKEPGGTMPVNDLGRFRRRS